MPLLLAPIGQEVRIVKIIADERTKKHLANLGVLVDATVTVLSASVLADGQWHSLDEAGALPAGLYVLTLTDGTEMKSRTVLVE